MDSELKKTSMRANSLEKKRFEMMLAAFDSAKRNVAVDMKKSQLEFKRRLKRYKDRQREIIRNRSDPDASSMEEFILKHLRRRGQMSRSPSRPLTTSPSRLSSHPHSTPRPPTPPRPHASVSFSSDSNTTNNSNNSTHGTNTSNTSTHDTNTSNSSDNCQRTARTRALTSTAASSALEEDEEDVVILSHCRRSKVDLRPCTAWSAVRQSSEWFKNKATNPGGPRLNAGNVKLLQLRGGRLGTPARQVRYLNDEEIEERGTFYRFLLDGYRHMEHNRLQSLGHRVNQFCGKTAGADSSNSGDTSCPPLVKVGVVSLPPGVPPIIQQAMRVKVSLLNSPVGVHRAEMR
ncbi:uncharacterized protein [Littorina saxatilis]|uniref:Uncharacterized protein n=1 Tax=Littorina saxatilis TaxID=31220 RepID=A0AAN9BHG8_9CAEN